MSFFKDLKRFPFRGAMIAAILIAAAVLIWERQSDVIDRTAVPESGKSERGKPEREKKDAQHRAEKPERPEPALPEPERRGRRIVVIIDDIGSSLRQVDDLARIAAPIAFAILPHTPYAGEAARRLHAAGKEILLHLPMEPRSYPADNPGKGALFVNMSDDEIRRQLVADLADVPYISGVNNHMGSRFMEDEGRLLVVMRELSKRGLFFVDSMTTSHSRGREAAAAAGVRIVVRNVFIDHVPGYAAALASLTDRPGRDRETGKPLLMIGHPHPETIRALSEAQALWQEEGTRMIPLSAYLTLPGAREASDTLAKENHPRQK